jgi:hypothetical protein
MPLLLLLHAMKKKKKKKKKMRAYAAAALLPPARRRQAARCERRGTRRDAPFKHPAQSDRSEACRAGVDYFRFHSVATLLLFLR